MIINSFLGIHNTSPDRSIPDNALADAIDVIVNDMGNVIQRDGYTQSLALSNTTSYQTLDGVTYIISSGTLYRINDDLSLASICSSTATEFADFSRFLFTNDGWVIHESTVSNIKIPTPDNEPEIIITGGIKPAGLYTIVYTYVNADGVEGGISPSVTINLDTVGDILVYPRDLDGYTTNVYMTDADGEVLYKRGTRYVIKPILNANSFPDNVEHLEYWHECLYVSVPFGDYTLVFYSKPNHYHLYDYNERYFIIPGHIEAIKSVNEGIIICTNAEIYLYDGSNLSKLANYGVVAGRPIVKQSDGSLLIYTQRGVCSALPFTELTQNKVSISMGQQCHTAIMHKQGVKQFIALHDNSGGIFNKFI